MLRAVRFASEMGFEIEAQTFKKIMEFASHILNVSKERWTAELDKIIMTENPSYGMNLLMTSHLLRYIIPELSIQYEYNQNTPHHKLDLWSHTLKTLDNVPGDKILRWSALLHDIGKPYARIDKTDWSNYKGHEMIGAEMVKKIGYYLRWPADRVRAVSEIVAGHMSDGALKVADRKAKE